MESRVVTAASVAFMGSPEGCSHPAAQRSILVGNAVARGKSKIDAREGLAVRATADSRREGPVTDRPNPATHVRHNPAT